MWSRDLFPRVSEAVGMDIRRMEDCSNVAATIDVDLLDGKPLPRNVTMELY